jgi:hypothetical protein
MSDPEIAIYVIGPPRGPVKIGLAVNPQRRLKTLQTGHDRLLSITHSRTVPAALSFDIERRAHFLVGSARVQGEWFNVSHSEAKEAVDRAVADGGKGEKAKPAVGRPPIKKDLKVEKTTLWLHRPVVDRIIEIVGKQGLSQFMREAAEAELRRREKSASGRANRAAAETP